MEISAIVKILIVFMGVLVGSRLKLPLGLALMGGGLGLEIWAGKQSPAILADLAQALSRPELWLLMLNITLILEFGYFMAEESNSNTIITAARRWGGRHGWAFSLILIPATIGLVPMPGGALFSAPMVGQAVKEDSWPSAWKAAVNYWFRHILEYWWPLYPVVIVTLSIFTIESWQFMAVQMPFTLISIAAGYFFLLRNHSQALQFQPAYTTDNSTLFPVLLPILLIVLSTLLLPPLYSLLFPGTTAATSKLLSMLTGLLAGLLLLNSSMKQTDGQRLFRFLFTLKTGNVLLTLGGVMIFQALLETSGLLPQAARQLTETQVPLPVIIGFLPFLAGLVTGIAIGYAGTAFPLIVGLMAVEGTEFTPISTLVLAFTMGYTGMMLSPVHLCFVLTREYFAAPYVKVLLYLMPCVLTVGACGIMLHLLLKILGW
jgi:integral membrane protein (TIGR00529 family)